MTSPRYDLLSFEEWKAAGCPDDGGIFRTATGWLVNALRPSSNQVRLEDIARSLSRQCRFAGHLAPHVEIYSVAQHSVFVSHMCRPEHALLGLLHDASEAYTQDFIRPIKKVLGDKYAELERGWQLAIGETFGVGGQLVWLPQDVEDADRRALATEQRDLAVGAVSQFEPYADAVTALPLASQSYELFMDRFRELIGVHSPAGFVS